jgi:poly(3-hydroxybutyrate) depolymerase
MDTTSLEQVIEAVSRLPLEDRRRLQEWLAKQERCGAEAQQQDEKPPQDEEKFRKALQWVEEHRDEYLGQWVVLDGDHLISHGTDSKKVYDEARAAGIQAAFLKRIVKEELPFGGW